MDIEKILILDDEMIIRRTLQEYCNRRRIKVKAVALVKEALLALDQEEGFDLMILDVNLPDGDGSEVLEAIKERSDPPLAVMITGQGTIESAVQCMQLGAFDYILKPFSHEQIDMVLSRASKYNKLVQVNRYLSKSQGDGAMPIVGQSQPINKLRDLISCVARTDATVMIHGETGTGKELIAQAIHQNSLRKDSPFIKVNCAAVSESLIESEFFGHEKGAFTGAMQNRIGRFELADGGTLLLDEISEVSLALQAKLLRVLQEKELERVGGNKTIKVDVRIVATTNRDLTKSIEAGEFRQDLYYRLNVFPLYSPALQERQGDIPLLARYFLKMYARKHGRKLKNFSSQALKLLERHTWPGNVRELQNVVERAVILSIDSDEVGASSLPLEIQIISGGEGSTPLTAPVEGKTNAGTNETALQAPLEMIGDDAMTMEAMERSLILRTLEMTDGNRTRAAEMMQISIRTLFNKLNQYKKKGFDEFEPYFNG